jgi:hypothetical protein
MADYWAEESQTIGHPGTDRIWLKNDRIFFRLTWAAEY